MRTAVLVTVVFCLFSVQAVFSADLPAPSTTLTAETSNNTSASPVLLAQTNGNAGAGNVSKVPIRSLLYTGASTRIYAHVEPWWGSSKHPDVGYSSQDPSQVHRQVIDMISRGLDGAAVDWYGPDSYEALGVKLLLAEAETHANFTVFVEVEHGAVLWDSCYPGCNATTAVIQLFTRVANDFFSSPAYARMGGRPLVREFAMEVIPLPSGQINTSWNVVDWNAVQAQVPGNPLVIHRNLGGFSMAQSGGAYGWMEPKTLANEPANYDGTDELNWFYSNHVASYSAMPAFGAVWKGFNDIQADWAPPGGRHIEQNCGQSWLRTFASANRYYSSSRQLAALQLITWNDYEEGSELETGIANCVTVAASLSGTNLQWSITGDAGTLDHYTVFISTDGEKLTSLGDLPVSTANYDLSRLALPAGSYSLFVKAVGKPSLRNQMSAPVAMTIAPPQPAGGGAVKNITIAATPSSLQVQRGQAAQVMLALTETGAADSVSLSCSNLPAGAACSFANSTLIPGAQPSSVALTISTSSMTASLRHTRPMFAFWLPGAAAVVILPGLGAMDRRRLRPSRRGSCMLFLVTLLVATIACGGGGTKQASAVQSQAASTTTTTATTAGAFPQATTFTITVNATSGTITRSAIISLTVQ
jgi:hypothetical protein